MRLTLFQKAFRMVLMAGLVLSTAAAAEINWYVNIANPLQGGIQGAPSDTPPGVDPDLYTTDWTTSLELPAFAPVIPPGFLAELTKVTIEFHWESAGNFLISNADCCTSHGYEGLTMSSSFTVTGPDISIVNAATPTTAAVAGITTHQIQNHCPSGNCVTAEGDSTPTEITGFSLSYFEVPGPLTFTILAGAPSANGTDLGVVGTGADVGDLDFVAFQTIGATLHLKYEYDLTEINQVPEPATGVLVAGLLAGGLVFRRRKAARQNNV